MWLQAKNAVRMFGATMNGLEIIGRVTHASDRPKEALATVSAITVAIVEGYQGRIAVDRLEGALGMLAIDLQRNDGVPLMQFVDAFRAAL